MPTWPTPDGKRTITLELPVESISHLDAQARYEGCSRAAYVRQLIVRDIERQGTTRKAAAAKA